VLAPNGNIYFMPASSTRVLVLNPNTNSLSLLPTPVLPQLGSGLKYFGGVLAPNGKIYGIPDQANVDSVLIIDPKTNTIDTNTITGIATINNYSGWKGAVLHPNGKIYCVPYTARRVLVIDPQTNTVDKYFITDLWNVPNNGDEFHRWHGGVLAPNGKIYCIPLHFNPRVLIIDPESPVINLDISSSILENSTLTNLTLNCPGFDFSGNVIVGDNILITTTDDLNNGNTHYTGYVSGISGENLTFIWRPVMSLDASGNPTTLVPSFIDIPAGKIINLRKTRRADVTTISNFPESFFQYSGGALGADGAIYAMPYLAGNIRRIDPNTNTHTTLSLPSGTVGEIRHAVLAPNGKIYSIPSQANLTGIATVDTLDASQNRSSFTYSIQGNGRFFGAVLASNGNIYCCPGPGSNTNGILQIKTGLPKLPSWMLKANFNKF
jgi:streptogramin lyase